MTQEKCSVVLFAMLAISVTLVGCMGEAGGLAEVAKAADATADAACPIDGYCLGTGQVCADDPSIVCICDARGGCSWARPKSCSESPAFKCEDKLQGNFTILCGGTKFFVCCNVGGTLKWAEGKVCLSAADAASEVADAPADSSSPDVAVDATDGGVDGDAGADSAPDVLVADADSGPGDTGVGDSGDAVVAVDADAGAADTGAPDSSYADSDVGGDATVADGDADTGVADTGSCSIPEPKGFCTAMCAVILRCDPPLKSTCCAGTWTAGTCLSCLGDSGGADAASEVAVDSGPGDTSSIDSDATVTEVSDTGATDTGPPDTGSADTGLVDGSVDTSSDAVAADADGDAKAEGGDADTGASDTGATVVDAVVTGWTLEYTHDTTVATAKPIRVLAWSTAGLTTGGFGLTELVCSKSGATLACVLPGVPGKELQVWGEIELSDGGAKGWTCYAVAPCEYKLRGTFTVVSPAGVRTVLTAAWNQDTYTTNRCWSCNAALGSPLACAKEKVNCVP